MLRLYSQPLHDYYLLLNDLNPGFIVLVVFTSLGDPCSPLTNHFLMRMLPTKFSKHGDSSFPESTTDVNGNQPSDRARRIILFHRTCPCNYNDGWILSP
ncbi:hypothetical protein E2986_09061 [Frieseomelitta varia]|uniref:Uncharacterized protein n=1 Tax=Frieseomelitta varia TaxID=561572 RepID=A0A833RUB4_9HYME|nr:hypothetical protein E2986_09061 [Frieseomelitta varia]